MADTLRLEFACTDAEMKHARSLHLERQVGGGSKVLTTIVLLLILAAMLVGAYFRIRQEVPERYRPYAYAAIITLSIGVWLWQRLRARAAEATTTVVEVSDDSLRFRGTGGDVRLPWSSFGRVLESPEVFVLVDRSGSTILAFPRRVFPSEAAQDWFHTLATNRIGLAERPSAALLEPPRDPAPGGSVCVAIRPRFADHLDRSMASWITRGFIAMMSTMMIGVTLSLAFNPVPNAVYSTTQVFFMFVLPFLCVMAAFVVLLMTVRNWWSYFWNSGPLELVLTPDSFAFRDADASGALPRSTYDRFKETRRNFLLWNTSNSAWIMISKGSFQSPEDATRCREILEARLRRSTWFFS